MRLKTSRQEPEEVTVEQGIEAFKVITVGGKGRKEGHKWKTRDFLGGPMAQTPACNAMQGAQVQSLDRELDPTCCN